MGRGGQLWRIGAVLILAFVVLYAVEPFTATNARVQNIDIASSGIGTTGSAIDAAEIAVVPAHCGAAIVDAWHSEPPSGWFGYAPLSDTSIAPHGSCRNESRHRLSLALVGVVGALGFVLAARWADLRPRHGLGPGYGPAI